MKKYLLRSVSVQLLTSIKLVLVKLPSIEHKKDTSF